ncbi:cytochrome P450 2J6-like isoform X3 [Octopus sinensis]|uniref:Cytochrome P450 2J6-like isoform X3 n=1 Tax=Octopus sinensis TaxID=2607531 RepID=A0A7E6F5E4_9MOLL|nr:cytochrome P450 2J6-like isoform X3 [Octopus sinensis]
MDVSASYFGEAINIQILLIGVVTLLLARWLITRSKYNYNLPPGPIAFPIIGNIPQMATTTDINLKMKELRKQFGGIFRLNFGSETFVIVCKTEWILEGLVKKGDEFKGRPFWMYLAKIITQKKGIAFNTGKEWKDLKKFTISTLRDLGMGKKKLEEQIYLEIQTLADAFQSHNGKPFSLKDPQAHFSLSIVYYIVFGERIRFGEPEFQEIADDLRFFFNNVSAFMPENFFPFLRFFRWNSPLEQIIKNNNKIRSYIKEKIREHKETFNVGDIRDFIDVYLLTLEKEPNSESLSEENIFQAIMDLFMAGTDTTSTIVNWAFVHMAKYPEIQDKCRAEIEKITDLNRPVTMEDKRHLTYVAATLLEVQRIAPVAPLTVPHASVLDTTLGGYDIPKNTIVQFNLMAAHYDPKYWDKPEEFRPERWIGENNELKKNEAYMPFSLGPRICAGISLANIETFMAFTNILQRFKLESPDETPMTMEGKQSGITYVPVNDNIRAIPL